MNNELRQPFIPSWLDESGLTAAQFRVYCRISRRVECTESLPSIAKGCRMNRNTVKRSIRELIDLGALTRSSRPGQTSTLRQVQDWQPGPYIDPGQNETRVLDSPGTQPKIGSGTRPKIGSTKVSPYKVAPQKAPKRSAFVPPSLEEVKLEARSIGLPPEQAEQFVDYYQSQGWNVGKNPMKDWKAALRNWKRNWQRSNGTPPRSKPATTQEMMREVL